MHWPRLINLALAVVTALSALFALYGWWPEGEARAIGARPPPKNTPKKKKTRNPTGDAAFFPPGGLEGSLSISGQMGAPTPKMQGSI